VKFSVSSDPKEITRILKRSDENHESIVWQSTPDTRTIYRIDQVNVDNVRKVVRFKLDAPSAVELNPDIKIYVKLSFRSTIFKGELIGQKDGYILVNVPDEIQYQELREFPRFSFGPEEDRAATIGIDSSLVSQSVYTIKVKLLDISQTGMGMIVSTANHDLIRYNAIQLLSLGDYNFSEGISSEVMYSVGHSYRFNGKRVKGYRIGTRFASYIEQEIIDSFIRSIEGFKQSPIGFLGADIDLQNTLHLQMDSTLKHLKSKNDLFYSLGQATDSARISKEDDYFSRHMKTLARISCGIAKALDMDTKKVIEKLIYASFVHDIAFYSNQKLALIKDLEHFEACKHELTAEEQELYLNAPKYSFDYAFYDKFAPKGVEKILIESRELPDGSGYPNKLSLEKISPLAAIFIVAHDLTDHIFERKNWNYQQYLTGYRKKFSGGIFDDIAKSLNYARKHSA
jgi:hypothetical protein